MVLSTHFIPYDTEQISVKNLPYATSLIFNKLFFLEEDSEPDLSQFDIALLGVPEARNSYKNSSSVFDEIRRCFINLFGIFHE